MKLVDANVLLYAVNEESRRHEDARMWLDGALSGGATVGFAWIALLAFARLATRPAIFPRPLTVVEAFDIVDRWLGAPSAVVLEPAADHARIVSRLLTPLGTGGNLVNDAHLAALAVSHGATVVTFDRDFGRFAGVDWEQPSDE